MQLQLILLARNLFRSFGAGVAGKSSFRRQAVNPFVYFHQNEGTFWESDNNLSLNEQTRLSQFRSPTDRLPR